MIYLKLVDFSPTKTYGQLRQIQLGDPKSLIAEAEISSPVWISHSLKKLSFEAVTTLTSSQSTAFTPVKINQR